MKHTFYFKPRMDPDGPNAAWSPQPQAWHWKRANANPSPDLPPSLKLRRTSRPPSPHRMGRDSTSRQGSRFVPLNRCAERGSVVGQASRLSGRASLKIKGRFCRWTRNQTGETPVPLPSGSWVGRNTLRHEANPRWNSGRKHPSYTTWPKAASLAQRERE